MRRDLAAKVGRTLTVTLAVELVVTAEGAVEDLKVLRSTLPAFEGAATESVKCWRFRPAVKAGQPVRTRMQVPIVFTLDDEETKAGPAR